MISRPCAYCGSTDVPRHKGHIVSKSLYPDGTPVQIQRATVPECATCQKLWTDAETKFRNVLLIAGDTTDLIQEKWKTVLRSFEKPSGKKWVQDLYQSMVPIETETGIRHMVYPHRDPSVNLVLRKIVRGFVAYHNLGTAISDDSVWVGYVPSSLPMEFRDSLLTQNLGLDFLRYGYALFDDEGDIHSAWLIRFYNSREFLGIVSKTGNATAKYDSIFNP